MSSFRRKVSLCIRMPEDVLGDAATQLLKGAKLGTVETASGLKYVTTDNGSILLRAPSNITSFDDIEKETDGTVLWCEIGSNAFSGCADLTALAIPDTVSMIDSNAFAGCENLQLTLLETIGKITIKEDAFDPDSVLQLVAFNSTDITFSDPDLPYKVSCFVPYDSTVNSNNVSIWGDTYTLKQGTPASLLTESIHSRRILYDRRNKGHFRRDRAAGWYIADTVCPVRAG